MSGSYSGSISEIDKKRSSCCNGSDCLMNSGQYRAVSSDGTEMASVNGEYNTTGYGASSTDRFQQTRREVGRLTLS